jgi:8-oxo-dGTP pyrophosphatase MutT (NUDIX family)
MPLLPGKKNVGHNIEEMEDAGHPRDQSIAAALNVARKRRDDGGPAQELQTTTVSTPGMYHVGPIHAAVAGRTDHLPMTVESGSYVLPADIVSAGGEGNTLAGFKVLRRTFGGEPYGQTGSPYGQTGGVYGLPVRYAKGGSVKAAGVMFVTPEREVLLMRRTADDDGHKGEWAFPAGGVETGERPEEAARREVREETGHEHDGGLAPFMHSDSGKVEFTTYLAHAPHEFKPTLNHEHDRAEWVSLDEAQKLPLHPGVRKAIEKFRAGKAAGGAASGVPIVAAGGEWVISPSQVKRVGNGDIDVGHRVLDEFVKRVRKELIGTLQNLPGPQRD